jgi:type II secretory pathway pseudopilin PulG
MDGYIAIALVGVILFVAGLVLRRARITKSREERMEEYYRDYQQRMDKFRKQ